MQQFTYVHWVLDTKRESTRKRRIQEVVERSSRNEKPGE
ncbi:MAG: YdeI/OmpD-associated family protein [Candidatus Thorarchaeota archaeon]